MPVPGLASAFAGLDRFLHRRTHRCPGQPRRGLDWRAPLRRHALRPALNHGGVTFTVVMALTLSTMFMSITGGALTSYERQTLQTAFVGVVLGNAEAQERLTADADAPYIPRPSVHLVPLEPIALPGPPLDADVALLGADLLGGPLPGPPRRALTVLAEAREVETAPANTPMPALAVVAVTQHVEAPCAERACALPIAADADMGDIAAIDLAVLQ